MINITDTMLQKFQSNGFFEIPDFFSKHVENNIIDLMREFIQKQCDFYKLPFSISNENQFFLQKDIQEIDTHHHKIIHKLYESMYATPIMNQMFFSNKLIDIAKKIIGCDENSLYCTSCRLRIDPPGDRPYRLDWHQEAAYTKNGQLSGVQFWSPMFFPASAKNGTIEVFSGSHLSGLFPCSRDKKSNSGESDSFFIEEKLLIDRFEKITIECEPRTLIVFSSALVHKSSNPKVQKKMKYSFISRFENIHEPCFSPFGFSGEY